MGADVVVVVGGGRGIGLATARVLGARGDAVVVVDCDAGSIERIRACDVSYAGRASANASVQGTKSKALRRRSAVTSPTRMPGRHACC